MTWSEFVVGVSGTAVGGGIGWVAKSMRQKWLSRRPLDVLLDEDPRLIYVNYPNWVSFPYFFNRSKDEIPPPPPGGPLAWWEWARQQGALPAAYSESQITLSSRTDSTVLVDSLEVKVTESEASPVGTIVSYPVGGADITLRQISAKLSTFASRASFVEPGGEEATGAFMFSLSRSEVGRVSITASPEDRNTIYRWRAILNMIVNGKRVSIPVGGAKHTFSLHGGGGVPWVEWREGQWVERADMPGAFDQAADG